MKEKLKKRLIPVCAAIMTFAGMALTVSADDSTTTTSALPDGVATAITSGMTNIQSGVTEVMGIVIPVALAIMGAILVVTIAIRLIKRFTGR